MFWTKLIVRPSAYNYKHVVFSTSSDSCSILQIILELWCKPKLLLAIKISKATYIVISQSWY